jgi:hypothetical protein
MLNIAQLRYAALAGLLALSLALPAWGQVLDTMENMDKATAAQVFKQPGYSPYAGRNFPIRPFSGDTHLHTSNFFGKLPAKEPPNHRWNALVADFGPERPQVFGWEQTSSGYAAVWAMENTREALWDAMQRKEVYGTTGPRMVVRFFGGWDFEAQDA